MYKRLMFVMFVCNIIPLWTVQGSILCMKFQAPASPSLLGPKSQTMDYYPSQAKSTVMKHQVNYEE